MKIASIVVAICAAFAAGQPDHKVLQDVTSAGELVELVRKWESVPDLPVTWYIKAGEFGDGTSTSDYAGSLADIAASVRPGDTVSYVGGLDYREFYTWTVDHVRFVVEAGTGEPAHTGRQLISPADWEFHTTISGRSIYKKSVDSAPVGFVYGYGFGDVIDVNGDTQSLPIGHLPEAPETTLAEFVAAIAGSDRPSWYFNGGNSTLFVYLPNNDDPRSSGVTTEWLRNPRGAAFRINADGVVFDGFRFDCGLAPAVTDTYWLQQCKGTTGVTFRNCRFSDGFYHLAGATGGVCVDNVYENCTFLTVARGTDSSIVQYSNSGALTGGVFRDCTVHLSDLRRYDGAPLNRYGSNNPIKGLAGHAGASGSIGASGLVFDHITMIDYADCHGSGGTQAMTASGGHGSGPNDRDDVAEYQWIIRDSVLQASLLGQCQTDGYVAFQRCCLILDGTVSGGIGQANFAVARGGAAMYESCTFVGAMTEGTNSVMIRSGGDVTLSNSTLYCAGSTDGLYFGAATGSLKSTHCAFVRENPGYLTKGGSMNLPTMSNNWYDRSINDNQFAVPGAFNSQAEWEAFVDVGARYDVDFSAQFTNMATLEPGRTSELWTRLDPLANPDAPTGINGQPYRGNAGAWQSDDLGAR